MFIIESIYAEKVNQKRLKCKCSIRDWNTNIFPNLNELVDWEKKINKETENTINGIGIINIQTFRRSRSRSSI